MDNDYIDWDSYLDTPEPFYAEALPCESCGKPVDCERKPAPWDEALQVGPCCFDIDSTPELPVCQELYRVMMRCESVGQMMEARRLHKQCCPTCGAQRKGVEGETQERRERAA